MVLVVGVCTNGDDPVDQIHPQLEIRTQSHLPQSANAPAHRFIIIHISCKRLRSPSPLVRLGFAAAAAAPFVLITFWSTQLFILMTRLGAVAQQ